MPFKNALSGLKFTRQNAEKYSSAHLLKQNFPGVHAPDPLARFRTYGARRSDL